MTKHLTSEQRYAIYLGLERGWSKSCIAREIGVHASTVCREVKRNSNSHGKYIWLHAQSASDARRHGLQGNHRKPPELWWRVEELLRKEEWSPAQIAGVLRKEGIHIVKQTIYNHIHADGSGRLAACTPHGLKYTRRKKAGRVTKVANIKNRTSIHERPPEADGKRFGDWEMDTIVDSHGNAILTLTERSTNYLLMEKLPYGRKAKPCAKAVIRLLFPFRDKLHTITTDNGCEFAAHRDITKALSKKDGEKVIVYFADSYASWQKGAIENANKLIRRYIPKKANFKDFSTQKISNIQYKLNQRPREKLNFTTPKIQFYKQFS